MALNDLDVVPLGRASVDSLRWTQGDQDRITLVAKATFKQGEGDKLELCDPEPLHDADMVPYRTRADVHVYGDRAQNQAADVAVSGDDPLFGAPVPVHDAPGLWQPSGDGAAPPSLPDDIDWDDYQRAEGARQTPLLSGLEHVSASAGGQRIIEGDLPPWRGVVYVADKGQSWEQGDRIPMEADSLQIDSDRGLCSLVYRSVFWLDADDDLTNRVLHVGLEYAPEAEDEADSAGAAALALGGDGGGLAGDGALAGDAAAAERAASADALAAGTAGEADDADLASGGADAAGHAPEFARDLGRSAGDAGAAAQSAKVAEAAAGAFGRTAPGAASAASAASARAAGAAGATDYLAGAAAAASQLEGLAGTLTPTAGGGAAAPTLVGGDIDPGFSAFRPNAPAATEPSSWDSSVGSSVYGRGVVGAGGVRGIQSGTMGSLAGDAMGGDSDEQATTTIKRSGAAGLAPTLPGTDAIRSALYERFKAFG